MPAPAPQLPVAVFDSGVGGLTVLHELLISLPTEDYVYLGDTARFPYGDRGQQELREFAIEIAEHLLESGAKLLVVACNAASAAALGAVQAHLDRRRPRDRRDRRHRAATQMAVAASHSGRIGVLATPATVASGAYERAVRAADPHVHLESVACPDLAPIIQSGFPFDDSVVETVREYCAPLKDAEVDTVILGCTHYPLVAPMLQRMLGRGVSLITSGAGVARSVERALASRRLLNPRSDEGSYTFRCTGDVDGVSSARHAVPADAAGRGQARRARRPSGGVSVAPPASAATDARPISCARPRSNPALSAPRRARR